MTETLNFPETILYNETVLEFVIGDGQQGLYKNDTSEFWIAPHNADLYAEEYQDFAASADQQDIVNWWAC